jgi:inosine-uridine nucleoside N-ribohydrolase
MLADMTSVPMILDCDPGHDDAIAILVAVANADLLGITTVAGNAPVTSTTRNAIVILDLAGRADVPVHSGASRPLVAPPKHAAHVHGESGIDGSDLPEPSRPATSDRAVDFLIETVRANEGTWLVPTGPLTNIAIALRLAPDLAAKVGGISLMGGGRFGNITTAAEFNIWADPEAADIVFGYGGPLTMAGLDLTHQLRATPPRIERVRAIGTRLSTALAELFDFFSATYIRRHDNMDGGAVHDPCAVMALTHPELFTTSQRHVMIETAGVHTRGMTLIDDRGLIERGPSNATVLETIDADGAWDVIVAACSPQRDASPAPT